MCTYQISCRFFSNSYTSYFFFSIHALHSVIIALFMYCTYLLFMHVTYSQLMHFTHLLFVCAICRSFMRHIHLLFIYHIHALQSFIFHASYSSFNHTLYLRSNHELHSFFVHVSAIQFRVFFIFSSPCQNFLPQSGQAYN